LIMIRHATNTSSYRCDLLAEVFKEEILPLPEDAFKEASSALYSGACDALSVSTASSDLRSALAAFLKRAGVVYGIVDAART